MSKENREADRRAHILEVAGRLFLDRGFAGTSMSEVAAAGAGSKGTIYTYFASKEDLFLEFMSGEIRTRATMTFDPIDQGRGLRATVFGLGRRYIQLLTDPITSALFRVVVHEAPRFPEIGRIFHEVGPKAAKQKLADYLEHNVAAGKLKIADVPMAVDQFLMLCQARIMQEFLFGIRERPSEADIDVTVGAAVTTFLAAYATDRCD